MGNSLAERRCWLWTGRKPTRGWKAVMPAEGAQQLGARALRPACQGHVPHRGEWPPGFPWFPMRPHTLRSVMPQPVTRGTGLRRAGKDAFFTNRVLPLKPTGSQLLLPTRKQHERHGKNLTAFSHRFFHSQNLLFCVPASPGGRKQQKPARDQEEPTPAAGFPRPRPRRLQHPRMQTSPSKVGTDATGPAAAAMASWKFPL